MGGGGGGTEILGGVTESLGVSDWEGTGYRGALTAPTTALVQSVSTKCYYMQLWKLHFAITMASLSQDATK